MSSTTEEPIRDAALTDETFRNFARFIRPQEAESRWRDIPWQTDLREACRLAAEQGKPVFLWTMNGNPLGCT